MDERKMLEIAARVGGIDYAEYLPDDDRSVDEQFDDIIRSMWNPLRDNGDAFHLAVKLGMAVMTPDKDDPSVVVQWLQINDDGSDGEDVYVHEFVADYDGDPFAATRYAIVLATVEIEKILI